MLFLFPNEIIVECTEPNIECERSETRKKEKKCFVNCDRKIGEPTPTNSRRKCYPESRESTQRKWWQHSLRIRVHKHGQRRINGERTHIGGHNEKHAKQWIVSPLCVCVCAPSVRRVAYNFAQYIRKFLFYSTARTNRMQCVRCNME